MRNLTKHEIDNKPAWAVGYTIVANIITWYPTEDKQLVIMPYAKPVPRKEFDISDCKYLKFKHLTIMSHPSLQSSMLTIGHDRFDTICLDKNQAIEIAKLLGAIPKDLS